MTVRRGRLCTGEDRLLDEPRVDVEGRGQLADDDLAAGLVADAREHRRGITQRGGPAIRGAIRARPDLVDEVLDRRLRALTRTSPREGASGAEAGA